MSNPLLHTGGSRPHLHHLEDLTRKYGRPVTPLELFLATHTKNHDGVTFVDDNSARKAKKHNDTVAERFADPETQPTQEDLSQIFLESVGGKKSDGSVPGLGSGAASFYANVPGSSRSGRNQGRQNTVLQETVTELCEQLAKKREERELFEAQLDAQMQAQMQAQMEAMYARMEKERSSKKGKKKK